MPSTVVYATVADYKATIGLNTDKWDVQILEILESASRAIDELCKRQDGFVALDVATARHYAGKGNYYLYIDECVEITQVAVKDSPSDTTYTAWAATDWLAFRGDPKDPDYNSLPYHGIMVSADSDYAVFTSGLRHGSTGWPREHVRDSRRRFPTVEVTAKWGYAVTCPRQVYHATLAQCARWRKRFLGEFDDTVVSSEMGSMSYKLRGQPLDNDIAMMLTRLVRPTAGMR